MSAVFPPQPTFAFPGSTSGTRPSGPASGATPARARSSAGLGAARQVLASVALDHAYGLGDAARAKKRSAGLVVVVALHVLGAWALASGLGNKVVEIVKKPIQMAIIPEVVPPPPAPPPPKIEKIKEAPKVELPPAYVPPPEVAINTPPPEPVIQATQSEPPKEPVPIQAPTPEPKPAVVKQEISLACPGYQTVLAQMLEEAVDRVGVTGTVRTLIKVRGSQVVEAVPQSGPKEYYKYVQTAVKRMKCSAGGADEVVVSLDVQFSK